MKNKNLAIVLFVFLVVMLSGAIFISVVFLSAERSIEYESPPIVGKIEEEPVLIEPEEGSEKPVRLKIGEIYTDSTDLEENPEKKNIEPTDKP